MSIHSMHNNTVHLSSIQATDTNKYTTKKTTAIFCNASHSDIQERVALKIKQAREQATHMIRKKFESDQKIDTSINNIKEDIQNNVDSIEEHKAIISELDTQKKELQKEYGIMPDSQEQKDLELLEKANQGQILSPEECDQLNALEGVTAYQAQCLQIDDIISELQGIMKDTSGLVDAQQAALTDIHLERLKDNGMFFAQEGAKEIISNATKEIQGMVVQDALEILKVNEEKAKDKQEELQDTLGSQTEETEVENTSTETIEKLIEKYNKRLKALQNNFNELKNNVNSSLNELKGLIVDQQV